MTNSGYLTKSSVLRLYYQTLPAPVLQHLLYTVVSDACTLHSYGVLHSLLERELRIQSLIDGIILAALRTFTAH